MRFALGHQCSVWLGEVHHLSWGVHRATFKKSISGGLFVVLRDRTITFARFMAKVPLWSMGVLVAILFYLTVQIFMKSLLYAFFLLSIGSFCIGCGGGGGSELEGPEIGSVQAYLDDHPEEADDGDEVSEADEMGASDI